MVKCDVAIAGGGPAGLAAAIAARRKGLRVAVFEGLAPAAAIDKCCGEGLMPDALEALAELGVEIASVARMPVAGVRFIECGHAAEARFAGQNGAGVRRTTLHAILLEHARQAGASVFWSQPVRGLTAQGIRAGDEEVQCRWIGGADGSQSAVRRAAGLESPSVCPRRFGLRRHFRIEPWTDLVEAHWAHGVQAFVTPVAENEVDVAMLFSDPQFRYTDADTAVPAAAGANRRRGSDLPRSGRGDAIASIESRRDEQSGAAGRCFGLGRFGHRPRPGDGVSTSSRVGRGAGARRPVPLRRAASPPGQTAAGDGIGDAGNEPARLSRRRRAIAPWRRELAHCSSLLSVHMLGALCQRSLSL